MEALKTHIWQEEVKMASFSAEHNLPIAVADHLGPLVNDFFSDSKNTKVYQCPTTKVTFWTEQ